MKRNLNTTIRHYFNHLGCTLFVVLGLLGLLAPASYAASGAFTFSAATYAVSEGSGKINLTINRVGGSTGSATVSFRTNPLSATAGNDFVAAPSTTLTFAHRERQKVISVAIINDTLVDPNETFQVSLSSPSYGTILGSTSTAVVTIQDDDIITVDATAPTVSLTSPASSTTYTSVQTVTVAAAASDNIGVSKVELYDGSTLLATDTTAPHSFAWAITSAHNGSHSLTAKAYDAVGNSRVSAAAAVTVNIPVPDLTAPAVSLTSPVNGTTFTSAQTVTVTAAASDNIGVSKVELFDGATLLGSDTSAPYSFAWPISAANNGSHNLTVKAYDAAGNVSNSAVVAVTVNIAVVAPIYEAPVLNSVTINNGSYLLAWSQPASAYGIPAGGYDIFIDTLDTNATYRTNQLTANISGLSTGTHCFQIEARWTQATGITYPLSNQVCAGLDMTAPTVSLTSPVSGTTFTSAQTVTVTAAASDNIGVSKVELFDGATLLGSDTSAPYSFAWPISAANNGNHNLTVKAYDAAGNVSNSAVVAVTVNIAVVAPIYEAPVLNSVTINNGSYLLAWSQPASAYGIPAGGYDIFIDTLDTNATYRTNQLTANISGLSTGTHCFQIEARWTQATGITYPLSNQVCAGQEATPTPTPSPTPTTRPDGLLPTFPGAEGFGAGTSAGRGGKIIKVTNLNDSGTGSLRAAVTASGPRIVVFEVAGRIDLLSTLSVQNPYLTIAGQTAPEPGIELTTNGMRITTHDVLIQHIRVRIDGGEKDAIGITAYQNEVYNVVVDHVTTNWASDENMEIWSVTPGGNKIHDITISNCLLGESGYGMLIGTNNTGADWINNISIIDNLFAHNSERDPLIGSNSNVFIANNLAYNSVWSHTAIVGSYGPKDVSFVGNHYIGGPNGNGSPAIGLNASATPGNFYVSDCLVTGRNVGSLIDSGISSYRVTTPAIYDKTVSIASSSDVRANVLSKAGARPAMRDSVEERIITEVLTETGTTKNSVAGAGGWPAEYNFASYRYFDAGLNPSGDDDGDGYTNVEEILHQMSAQVEGR